VIAARVPNSSKMGRVSLWEIRVNVRFAWIFFRFGVVVFHIGKRRNSPASMRIWRYLSMNRYLAKEFQFGTQSDYVSVLALIMETVQEIGGVSSCRQRRVVQPQD